MTRRLAQLEAQRLMDRLQGRSEPSVTSRDQLAMDSDGSASADSNPNDDGAAMSDAGSIEAEIEREVALKASEAEAEAEADGRGSSGPTSARQILMEAAALLG